MASKSSDLMESYFKKFEQFKNEYRVLTFKWSEILETARLAKEETNHYKSEVEKLQSANQYLKEVNETTQAIYKDSLENENKLVKYSITLQNTVDLLESRIRKLEQVINNNREFNKWHSRNFDFTQSMDSVHFRHTSTPDWYYISSDFVFNWCFIFSYE